MGNIGLNKTDREKLIAILDRYFDIGDSYAYNLTRAKSAFACGTMGFDDFEEFDEETVADIVDDLIEHGVTIPVRCKDCKHYVHSDTYPVCTISGAIVDKDEFCSYGERKEE